MQRRSFLTNSMTQAFAWQVTQHSPASTVTHSWARSTPQQPQGSSTVQPSPRCTRTAVTKQMSRSHQSAACCHAPAGVDTGCVCTAAAYRQLGLPWLPSRQPLVQQQAALRCSPWRLPSTRALQQRIHCLHVHVDSLSTAGATRTLPLHAAPCSGAVLW